MHAVCVCVRVYMYVRVCVCVCVCLCVCACYYFLHSMCIETAQGRHTSQTLTEGEATSDVLFSEHPHTQH